jgi:hypothetical protein
VKVKILFDGEGLVWIVSQLNLAKISPIIIGRVFFEAIIGRLIFSP